MEQPAARLAAGGPGNINKADVATLDGINGISPAAAESIVEYRASDGPFKRIEDLQNVKGIEPALFSKIKDQKYC